MKKDVVTINEGDGYKIRATLIKTDTTQIVVVDWEHPNYGYFSDGGVFVRFAHSTPGMEGWRCLSTASWMSEYEAESGPEDFVKKYPGTKKLFEQKQPNPLIEAARAVAE